ncbi:hypothetical protein G6549_13915 [Bacillus sp. MM2020_1]|nr:hypothetical protein [Bacillus sp. MM2020_1]
MTRLNRSHEELTLEQVAAYYTDSLEAIRLLKQNVLNGVPPISNQFVGLTVTEVREIFEAREMELDRLATFNILAATEASLRVDFHERVNKRGKSDLDRAFLRIYREKRDKISLEEHIIDEWKEFKSDLRHIFTNFKGLLSYRHWLAHGRYWTPNLSLRKNDFDSLYPICFEVEKILRDNR